MRYSLRRRERKDLAMTDIASAIRTFVETQPWKQADAGIVFALGKSEGGRSYAVLMEKKAGCSLVLCENEKALSAYATLVSARARRADEMELIALTLEQNSMELWLGPAEDKELNEWLEKFGVGTPKWSEDTAALLRREPGVLPRPLCKAERERLAIAIHAAVDYVRTGQSGGVGRAGLSGVLRVPCAAREGEKGFAWSMIEVSADMVMEFPSPCLQDELALRRMMKKKPSGHEFICALRMLPILLEENSDQLPCAFLMIDSELNMVGAPVAQDIEADASALAGEFLRYVEEFGRPSRIRPADPRSYCLLHGLAGQLGVRIEKPSPLTQADAAMRQFLEYMLNAVRQEEPPKKETKKSGSAKENDRDICVFCGKELDCGSMQKHLKECVRIGHEAGNTPYLMLRVTCPNEEDFRMYLEVKKDTSLKQLDQFLRDRWLECCGHMSAFLVNEEEYYSYCDEPGMRGMSAKLETLVNVGDTFLHQYDFGSPTDLVIEVIDEYTAKDRRKKVVLAAQNIMPKYSCVRCGKPAKLVFRPDMGPVKESVFCEECGRKEKDARMLPLMNSPRTGVCGYGLWMNEDE